MTFKVLTQDTHRILHRSRLRRASDLPNLQLDPTPADDLPHDETPPPPAIDPDPDETDSNSDKTNDDEPPIRYL